LEQIKIKNTEQEKNGGKKWGAVLKTKYQNVPVRAKIEFEFNMSL
jgi:hypothetical protein